MEDYHLKCITNKDLFHKWRLLHRNEALVLFSRAVLVSNYNTGMTGISPLLSTILGLVLFYVIGLVFKVIGTRVSVRVRI